MKANRWLASSAASGTGGDPRRPLAACRAASVDARAMSAPLYVFQPAAGERAARTLAILAAGGLAGLGIGLAVLGVLLLALLPDLEGRDSLFLAAGAIGVLVAAVATVEMWRHAPLAVRLYRDRLEVVLPAAGTIAIATRDIATMRVAKGLRGYRVSVGAADGRRATAFDDLGPSGKIALRLAALAAPAVAGRLLAAVDGGERIRLAAPAGARRLGAAGALAIVAGLVAAGFRQGRSAAGLLVTGAALCVQAWRRRGGGIEVSAEGIVEIEGAAGPPLPWDRVRRVALDDDGVRFVGPDDDGPTLRVPPDALNYVALPWLLHELLPPDTPVEGERDVFFAAFSRPPPSAPRLFALAVGAGFAHVWDDRSFDTLHVPASRERCSEALDDGWGVRDRAGVEATIAWLLEDGHEAEYRREHDRGTIHAWDLARVAHVARLAVTAGLLDERSAWAACLAAARRAQAAFRSWDELAEGVTLGARWFEETKLGPDGVRSGLSAAFADAHRWLRTSPRSPWRRLDWRTPLG